MQPERSYRLPQDIYQQPRPTNTRLIQPLSIDGISQLPRPFTRRLVQEPIKRRYVAEFPAVRQAHNFNPEERKGINTPSFEPSTPTANEPHFTEINHPAAVSKHSSWVSKLGTLLIIVICSALGLLASDVVLGQIAIGIYGAIAIVFRVKSQTTFTLALISLVCVPVLLLLKRQDGLAENFAVYAFLLLVVGVVSAMFELRQDNKLDLRKTVHTQTE